MGYKEKTAAEAKLIRQSNEEKPEPEQTSPMERLLFSVRTL